MSLRLLLLAGSAEARQVAKALGRMPEVAATASLAGTTARPADLGLPTRVGGFGGDVGFADYLARHRVQAVLDATHPFAQRIASRTARLCRQHDIAHARLLRPAWQAGPGDRWTEVATEAEVAAQVPEGARVFMATGPEHLDAYTGMDRHHVICRRIDPAPAPFPWPRGDFVVGRPPFTRDSEIALFRRFRVDLLVTKNAGGAAGRAKLEAARALGLPVVMVARPPQPEGWVLTSVDGALDWIREQTWTNASS
ncbi:cobalt-precorrin-6A reductase [Fluviibacterium sp. DFM31]|uniref:Cobalt-precorrin-6A reductase n=1 Tax=Meridianimarinicoccus marinus TaxID=3231483 RepID=A0ABV3L2J0_9RHOB